MNPNALPLVTEYTHRNPQPKIEGNPFTAPFNLLTDYIAGFGVGLSSFIIVCAAIMLAVLSLFGGRLQKVGIVLFCAIVAPILIINAGDFANLFT